jgi:hypothetical protein
MLCIMGLRLSCLYVYVVCVCMDMYRIVYMDSTNRGIRGLMFMFIRDRIWPHWGQGEISFLVKGLMCYTAIEFDLIGVRGRFHFWQRGLCVVIRDRIWPHWGQGEISFLAKGLMCCYTRSNLISLGLG